MAQQLPKLGKEEKGGEGSMVDRWKEGGGFKKKEFMRNKLGSMIDKFGRSSVQPSQTILWPLLPGPRLSLRSFVCFKCWIEEEISFPALVIQMVPIHGSMARPADFNKIWAHVGRAS